jgi:hypothetical protein
MCKCLGTLVYQAFILIICASMTGDRMPPGIVQSLMTSRIIDDIDLIYVCTIRSSLHCSDRGGGSYI